MKLPQVLTRATVTQSSATTADLVAAVTGQQIQVWQMYLKIGGANNLTFLSAATSLNGGVLEFDAEGDILMPFTGFPWFVTTASEALRLTTSTSAQVSGVVYYTNTPITVGN